MEEVELARGLDDRPVVHEQEAKSIGHEETFGSDIWDRSELRQHLVRMVDASATALRGAGLAARTVSVKIKFSDFTLVTRSHTMAVPIDADPAVAAVAGALLDTVELKMGVRLLGVSLSGFGHHEAVTQLRLDLGSPGPGPVHETGSRPVTPPEAGGLLDRAHEEAERIQGSWASVTSAVDAIRARYGGSSVGPASLVGADGLRIRRRGEAQWGPAAAGSPAEGDE